MLTVKFQWTLLAKFSPLFCASVYEFIVKISLPGSEIKAIEKIFLRRHEICKETENNFAKPQAKQQSKCFDKKPKEIIGDIPSNR